MFEREITINRFLQQYAETMAADIADERMTEQPLPGVNHPAWILGHLAYVGESVSRLLGGEQRLNEAWTQQFGPGSTPSSARGDYPSKLELVTALQQSYERARQMASEAADEQLARPNPHRLLKNGLPTVHDAVAFVLTAHFGLHLGQFSTWRRMIGLPHRF